MEFIYHLMELFYLDAIVSDVLEARKSNFSWDCVYFLSASTGEA